MRVQSQHEPRRQWTYVRPGELNRELARLRPAFFPGNRKSVWEESSKILRPPCWMTQASFSLVLEKFVEGSEHESGATGVDPHVKIDFVIEALRLAMSNHSEQPAIDVEI